VAKKPCTHPYEGLSISSNAAQRGAASSIRVSCQACGKTLAGNDGIVRFVNGMRGDMKMLRRAVINLGGELVSPAMVVLKPGAKPKRGECQHYLGWLRVGEDRSGTRGYLSSNTVKCQNCGKSWPDHTALLMVMKREVELLWLEVQRLGGKRER